MQQFTAMYQQMMGWLSKPLREDIPVYKLFLVFLLFIIVAYIVFDMLRILKAWSELAVDAASAAVS